jgi:hypothetical protein
MAPRHPGIPVAASLGATPDMRSVLKSDAEDVQQSLAELIQPACLSLAFDVQDLRRLAPLMCGSPLAAAHRTPWSRGQAWVRM